MLPGVAGKDHPAILSFGQPEDFVHLADAEQPGLVDPKHLPAQLRVE